MTTKVLMCPPEYYGVNYSINPWMDNNIGKVDRSEARRQWNCLHYALQSVTEVDLIKPEKDLPDMVFAANAGLVRDKTFYPSLFKHPERQPETPIWAKYFLDLRYDIIWPKGPFEGEGDVLNNIHGNEYSGYGMRSKYYAYPGLYNLQLMDERFYHLDTCFCPLPGGEVIYYPGAFNDAGVSVIKTTFRKTIEVSEADALSFACNAVAIGNKVFIPKNNDVTPKLYNLGYKVQEFEMSEFIKSGGACKCLVLYLD